ncbi:MAG: VWA domain-containing protein [Flavobacteriaceae bacterium]|jgi:Ca-activated chloride channel family protein|nr:VWA domain-containing protein [Flavobacteriaceae bacterium]HIF48470.1 VWA domain-containing protein [Cytophagales bacterium]MBT4062947.1 VWA domain-containing protein [Flavobacteriaceae bacterium]MBT4415421.1 VWA domain-containing protein [Flavobacteriaceae bacterium]MBT5596850.1 VWA domain-containing protein [Flavobacteriaceae bacterium]|tara:strand:+ start:61 stop:1062 length:1002 start_codon:yes stop_codon:yes gene_type:complete
MLQEITFYNPEFLWLLILLPLLVFGNIKINKKKSSQLKISSIKSLGVKSFKIKIYPILDILRYLAISMLIIALSRPQIVDVSTQTKTSKGIDIVIAVDVSSSMLAQDLSPNRLDALKEVAKEFINDRVSDRIGLVVYAGESYTKTPVTSDKSIIIKSLEEIKFDGVIEDGTAIGMGLATAVNRLKDSKAKSKVIILLTDGVNNSGFIDPNTAADLALSYEIKTYTIGLGSNGNALAPIAINPNGTFRFGLTKVEIDEKLLESIAKKTGGLYFRATDNKRLKDIYQEINKLEKTEVEEFKYTNAQERYRVFVLISFVLVFIEWLLKSTFFKSFI